MKESEIFNYAQRVQKLISILKNNEAVIFYSRDKMIKGDDTYFHSQDSMMTYFFSNNLDIESVIVCKQFNSLKLYIIIEEKTKIQEKFEGKIDVENIKQLFKELSVEIIVKSKVIEELNQLFQNSFFALFKCIEENRNYLNFANIFISEIEHKLNITIKNKFDEISQFRVIKEEKEIQAIQIANNYAKETFEYILTNISNYQNEQDIFADMSYKTFNQDSTHAFYPIIATGKNATILHYDKHNSIIKDSDLILLDFGCEYLGYQSDISRTIPKSGKFTQRQKEVYQAVLRIQDFALSLITEGQDIKEYELKIVDKVGEELINLNVLTQEEINEDKSIIRKYYPHRCSHYLGLDTHDCGNYLTTFKVGMVLTVEPGIYIEDEAIGIRIEDNIVIKENGIENLSKDIIKSVEEIEILLMQNTRTN